MPDHTELLIPFRLMMHLLNAHLKLSGKRKLTRRIRISRNFTKSKYLSVHVPDMDQGSASARQWTDSNLIEKTTSTILDRTIMGM
jgi:hypothetical protein